MPKLARILGTAFLALGIITPAVATTRYVIWWKAPAPPKNSVVALDLSTGWLTWQRQLPDSPNFAEEQQEGILVGCDDKALYLLSPSDGSQIWKVKLGEEVNEFHGTTAEGFLVSHDKAVYWLVSRDGKVVYSWPWSYSGRRPTPPSR